MLVEKLRDHGGIAAIRKHPDFHSRNIYVIDQFVKLRAQLRSRSRMHRFDALRGLYSERRNGGDAVTIVRRKGFQISGDTRATRRIESGDGKENWGCVVRMVIQSKCPPREAQKPTLPIFGARPAKKNVRALRHRTQEEISNRK
jgi:hypothetical protein